MASRSERVKRALIVGQVARRRGLRRVLGELGVVGSREATLEGAQAFRQGLEELGTTFIKLGQLLSSRPDLLPQVYIDELGHLVDEVEPVPFAAIERVIAEDIGLDAFVSIDPLPLATASVAQTHRALTKEGRDVVVKVRRPGIVEQVELDLALLRSTARLLEKHVSAARLIQLEALDDELEVHLRAELDLAEEAHNAELISGIVERFEGVFVPPVVHSLVSERVLVLEHVDGDKVTAAHRLTPERARLLAKQLFRAYVYQVVVEGVYHADPHHGNVLLTKDGRLALIDFGLIGRLDQDTRASLALLLFALAQNRAEDVAELIIELSWTDLDADPAGFAHDVRRKLPRLHWRPLKSIHAGETLADLQRLALEHGLKLPPSFALVGKTLAQADAIARALDPELDPVALVAEETGQVIAHEAARRLQPERLAADLYTQLEPLSHLPRRLANVVSELERGGLKIGIVPTGLSELERNLRSIANRVGAAIIVAALLLASAMLVRANRFEWLGVAGFCLAAVIGLYMVYKIIKTPGEL